jgi:hypothetical protein
VFLTRSLSRVVKQLLQKQKQQLKLQQKLLLKKLQKLQQSNLDYTVETLILVAV